jgi:hypothetical protein
MPTVYRVLGQSFPSINVPTNLYTVPANTSTVCSTLTVCNQGASSTTFSVAIRPNGAALTNQHYISYSTPLPANDTVCMTLGLTLGNADVLTVFANSSSVSFGLFGSELS